MSRVDLDRDGLSTAVLRLRRRRGWTQDYLAKVLDVTVHTVWAWEAGRQAPRTRHLLALVKLGLEIDGLVRGSTV